MEVEFDEGEPVGGVGKAALNGGINDGGMDGAAMAEMAGDTEGGGGGMYDELDGPEVVGEAMASIAYGFKSSSSRLSGGGAKLFLRISGRDTVGLISPLPGSDPAERVGLDEVTLMTLRGDECGPAEGGGDGIWCIARRCPLGPPLMLPVLFPEPITAPP